MLFMVDQKDESLKAQAKKDRVAVAMIVLAFLLICTAESLVEYLV